MFDGPAAVAVGDQVYFSASVPGADPRARELRLASLTTPDAPSDLIVVDQPAVPPEGAAPPAGVAFGIAGLDPAGVRLNWRDNSSNESGFVVERSRTSDFTLPDRTFFRPANTTSFVDTTGTPGAVYYYRIRAVNAGGDSAPTDAAAKSASIAGRYIFYNHSAFDGDDGAMGPADDAAIATDKIAYLVGPASGLPDSRSVSGYSRGINGVMVDIAGLTPGSALSAGDFQFEIGNGASWSAAPAAPGIAVRRGAGATGSDRVTFTFADNAIRNTWLRVTVLANAHTGLARPDVFYFGNLAGDTGDGNTAPFRVNALDLARVKRALNSTSAVTGRFDLNRDGHVNALDLGVIKANLNRTLAPMTAAAAASATAGPPFFSVAAVNGSGDTATRRVWDEPAAPLL
jgi:hypothetical protein